MYILELHGMACGDDQGGETKVGMRSFERRLGGTSGFKSLQAVEDKLIGLAEDLETEWENAFAVSKEGVGGVWWRLDLHDRTGGATDLKLGFAESGYDSAHYIHPGTALVNRAWDGQMSLHQADEWARSACPDNGKPWYASLFDPEQRRVVAAWEQPSDYRGIRVPLTLLAIGEHIN